ncbi:nucleotidyl transferase AbiEii/AbiGii toxin family protein [Methylobacterium sp. NEAU 140]|uniref:nucleotidyl transferase AbiEii/AbiGii toxin family protein n=1 Tax=Methylobacterium sp. NEAU 140 TaxID=3064945 RepID=UPI0027349629|nr:nucleotidyl transferase AbiEii/AbiGii toxin family protein [Methylobacterium sp. NEAU 140]MDP4025894.1 nucleotidyl transferase AbiEii/AbiGii toxin family protein [Methylobacterium sp. NEAU 140]
MSGPESRWRHLLDRALPALRYVLGPEDPSQPPRWTLGGGTALALWLDHRISFDIDLFVPTVPLRHFTPAENPHAAAISRHFQWPGHYLKYETAEGEIDFLSPPLQTTPGYVWTTIGADAIPLETPEETIVKKIRYRSARLTARDAFDIAAVAEARPALAEALAQFVPDALPRAIEALDFLIGRGTDLASVIRVTETCRPLLGTALDRARRTLVAAVERAGSTT